MMASAAIEARDLYKSFRTGQIPALDGVDFRADTGELIAITGPSGSGKSTLLYALSGLIPLDRGKVRIDGQAPATQAEWADLRSGTIGMVFQDDWLLPTLTAAENVELPMMGIEPDAAARRARAEDLLGTVGAGGLAERRPAGLSGGERQRVAIARSLANRPRVLMADEPTGDLDSASAQEIMDLLRLLWTDEGLTILVVTHDLNVAGQCQRNFVLCDGKGGYV